MDYQESSLTPCFLLRQRSIPFEELALLIPLSMLTPSGDFHAQKQTMTYFFPIFILSRRQARPFGLRNRRG
jgi:hypothetical protein